MDATQDHISARTLVTGQNLPPEVWTSVFLHYVQATSGPQPNTTRADILSREGPVFLAHVCQRWRDIILTSGELWSSFSVYVDESSPKPSLLDMLALWIARAGKYPLRFHLQYNPPPYARRWTSPAAGTRGVHTMNAVLRLLMPHVTRWHEAALCLPHQVLQPFKLDCIQNLRSFSIQAIGRSSQTVETLRSVLPTPLGWARLESLRLNVGPLSLDDCFRAIEESPKLHTCSLRAECIALNNGAEYRRIRHTSLRTLDLRLVHCTSTIFVNPFALDASTSTCFANFLDALDLPFLQSLDIHWLLHDGDPIAKSSHSTIFIDFLSRSAEELHVIRLSNLLRDEAQLRSCLEALPLLSEMDLRLPMSPHDDPFSEGLLRSLCSGNPASPTLIPLLTTLHLQCHGRALGGPGLIDVVNSRMQSTSSRRLQHLDLYTHGPASHTLTARAEDWVAEGMCVQLGHLSSDNA
ncbi:hypothetical protein HGRIS_008388 [Hohenbuehelia grisea]|uniref:F-box domain-containing protein n=1 Tax=Hohenbuehelia grisea TaxID=104357 RepID=A0ABR3J8A9_9AGAR